MKIKTFLSHIYLAAMQEETLKLVLLALVDGTPLSHKGLVMFVVQKLENKDILSHLYLAAMQEETLKLVLLALEDGTTAFPGRFW